jgi:hypothetical protein
MACFRTVTASEVALLEQLFAAERPGVIAHYILISTIACTERDDGPDTTSLASFLRDDGVQLGRAIVLGRLGKKVDYRVNQSSLDDVALPWRPTATRTVNGRNARRRLRRDVRETECSALADLVKPSKRDPHLRLRIALLALAGATLEGAPAATAEECAGALAAYRARVLAWLVPLCVASANADGSALPEPPANVDVAGRRAAAVLRSAFGTVGGFAVEAVSRRARGATLTRRGRGARTQHRVRQLRSGATRIDRRRCDRRRLRLSALSRRRHRLSDEHAIIAPASRRAAPRNGGRRRALLQPRLDPADGRGRLER